MHRQRADWRRSHGCGWKLYSGQRIKRKLDQCRNRSWTEYAKLSRFFGWRAFQSAGFQKAANKNCKEVPYHQPNGSRQRFSYDPQLDAFICPKGVPLTYHRLNCSKSTGKYLGQFLRLETGTLYFKDSKKGHSCSYGRMPPCRHGPKS